MTPVTIRQTDPCAELRMIDVNESTKADAEALHLTRWQLNRKFPDRFPAPSRDEPIPGTDDLEEYANGTR